MSGLPRGSRRAEREMRIRAGGYRAAWSGLGARGEAGGIKTSLCGDDSRRLVFRMHLKSVTPRNSHDRNSYSSSATPPQPPPPGPAPSAGDMFPPLGPAPDPSWPRPRAQNPPALNLDIKTPAAAPATQSKLAAPNLIAIRPLRPWYRPQPSPYEETSPPRHSPAQSPPSLPRRAPPPDPDLPNVTPSDLSRNLSQPAPAQSQALRT